MTSDIHQLIYEPSDMAGLLKIKESTLRKYCLLLEKEGYQFHKGESGRRWYSDHDLVILRRLITLKNGDMSLESASQSVVAWSVSQDKTALVIKEERDDLRSLMQQIKEQQKMIQTLTERLDQHQRYLQQRDEWILEEIKRNYSSVPELAAGTEEEKFKRGHDGKRSWWNRLFTKK